MTDPAGQGEEIDVVLLSENVVMIIIDHFIP